MLFFTLRKVESNALLLRFPPTDNPRPPPPPPSKIPHKKKRIYWGDCLKRKLGQFADLGEGGVFEGGGGSGRPQNICHH